MTSSSDLALLRFLARRTHATASQLCAGLGATPGEVRAHPSALESRRLVASRQDKDAVPPCRVFYVMAEGRRAAGISEVRATADI